MAAQHAGNRDRHKRREAEIAFHRVGITFSVYGEESGNERLIPFDMVPRIVPAAEWRMLEAGLRQRVHALNLFLGDVYGEQRILHDGRVPTDLVLDNGGFRRRCAACACPAASIRTSPASIWSAPATASTTCWKTICGCRPACRTCWKTGG